MKILTWNLWWRFGDWQARQPVIDRVLVESGADVICLQEVYCNDDEDQFVRIRDRLGCFGFASHDRDGDRAPFGNAILSRWPLERTQQVRLPDGAGESGHRTALIATLSGPRVETTIVNTHLAWQYDRSLERQRQLEAVLAEIPPAGPDHVVVLAGDLNAVADSDELRRLTGLSPGYRDASGGPVVFTDAWAVVGDGPGHTWTRDNPNSVDAQWPRRRIDHVMVGWPRPKPFANPVAASVVGDQPSPAGVVGSDHYAVLVELDAREPLPTGPDPAMNESRP